MTPSPYQDDIHRKVESASTFSSAPQRSTTRFVCVRFEPQTDTPSELGMTQSRMDSPACSGARAVRYAFPAISTTAPTAAKAAESAVWSDSGASLRTIVPVQGCRRILARPQTLAVDCSAHRTRQLPPRTSMGHGTQRVHLEYAGHVLNSRLSQHASAARATSDTRVTRLLQRHHDDAQHHQRVKIRKRGKTVKATLQAPLPGPRSGLHSISADRDTRRLPTLPPNTWRSLVRTPPVLKHERPTSAQIRRRS